MTLRLDDTIDAIDQTLARRRMGAGDKKGPQAQVVLAESLGIHTVGDLLHHYPRTYIDRSSVGRIGQIRTGEPTTVVATVTKVVTKRPPRQKRPMVVVTLSDDSGVLELAFFNQPWLVKTYRSGMELAVSGVGARFGRKAQLKSVEIDVLRDEGDRVHTARITPVHPAADGVSPRTIRELVHRALQDLPALPEPLPPEVVAAESLTSYDDAIRKIHFPADPSEERAARERLTFDELFTLELGVAYRKHRLDRERTGVAHDGGPLVDRLASSLPFTPTDAQLRVMGEVDARMARPQPMHLLLQGDVGAGKTLVALHACLVAIGSGHQAAIMAPTEVLAGQHLRSVAALLDGVGAVSYLEQRSPARAGAQASLLDEPDPASNGPGAPLTYGLLTSAVTGKDRERLAAAAAAGDLHLLIGTHALIQEGVRFADLSLAVIDEQHRFGLHQRTALAGKSDRDPDVLIMTATPIPRTLALTYYGDLDVAVLDEMPAGRRPITTVAARSPSERRAAENLVRAEVAAGHQAFVVCAAIDEANRTEVKAAEAEADRLATSVFPNLRVELLHGRMRPKDKQAIMDRFRSGQADILISTTVIEVGVDVPGATVMLVENAERFGLAQLHQLRGRIGRSALASTCVLFDESGRDNAVAAQRIDAMVRTNDGFELADEDLRLRGEGTLFDTKQSGMPDLKLARLAEDFETVRRARARAFELVEADPELDRHPELLELLRSRFAGSIDWLFRS